MTHTKLAAACALAAVVTGSVGAQTRIDLRTQGKSIDFSAAGSTKPSQTGTTLPAICSAGQTFLNTAAQPGQNFYICTAPNVWTVQGGPGTPNYAAKFTSVTSFTVPGATHQLGTANIMVQVFDNGNPECIVEPDSVVIDPATYNVTVKFAVPQSGTLVLSSAGGIGQQPPPASGAGMAAQLGDFLVTRTNSTLLGIGANCSAATPCNVRVSGVVYSIALPAAVTLSAGTGAAYIYLDSAGNLTVGHNLTLACSGCIAVSGITGFPVNSVPLFKWTATSNAWDATGTDQRAFESAKVLAAGPGIVAIEAGSQTQIGVDSAAVPTYLSATATLDFSSMTSQTCAELTLSLPGANTGDAVEPGWPPNLEPGLIGTMRVSASNLVAVRLCNFSGAALDPAAALYRATIVRSF